MLQIHKRTPVSESKRRIQEIVAYNKSINPYYYLGGNAPVPPLVEGEYMALNGDCTNWYVLQLGGKKRAVVVLENKLGRPIRKGYDSHHINFNSVDDRPENLEEVEHGEHGRLKRG